MTEPMRLSKDKFMRLSIIIVIINFFFITLTCVFLLADPTILDVTGVFRLGKIAKPPLYYSFQDRVD